MIKQIWQDKEIKKAFLQLVFAFLFFLLSIINLINTITIVKKDTEQQILINELKFELEYNNYVLEDSLKQ